MEVVDGRWRWYALPRRDVARMDGDKLMMNRLKLARELKAEGEEEVLPGEGGACVPCFSQHA